MHIIENSGSHASESNIVYSLCYLMAHRAIPLLLITYEGFYMKHTEEREKGRAALWSMQFLTLN